MRATIHAHGPRSADLVWERYARPELWPRWAPYILGVDTSDERIRAGSTGRVRGPLRLSATFVVTALDEAARTWSWHVTAGPLSLSLDHGVAAAGSGSRTWLTVDGPAPLLLAYLPPARISIELLVRR